MRRARVVVAIVVPLILMQLCLVSARALARGGGPAGAISPAVSIPAFGTPVSETFDSLATSGAASVLPAGWGLAESGTNANTTYAAGTGSSTTGDTYSFGSTGSAERALGGLRTGTLVPTFGAAFSNDTAGTIGSIDVAYTGEQWRLGTAGRGPDRLDAQYSLTATSLTTGTWTDVDALDFTSPSTGPSAGSRDGNAAANRAARADTIGGLSLAPGSTLSLRWIDVDVSGADDGLAIDDLSVTARELPSIAISDASIDEGPSGTTVLSFSATIAPPAAASASFATISGTASSGQDFAPGAGTVTFTAAEPTQTIGVTVFGDASAELDETFTVALSAVSGAVLAGSGSTIGTIRDDDAAACTIRGGPGNDNLVGTQGPDVICGFGGTDSLTGSGGDDVLDGGNGQDILLGGRGDDRLDGGDDADTAGFYDSKVASGVSVDLVAGTATNAQLGADTFAFAGGPAASTVEYIKGSPYADTLTGDARRNVLEGRGGNDVVSGGDGFDTLLGNEGNDTLLGEGGDDRLMPGLGDDVVDGGSGVNTLDYTDLKGSGPGQSVDVGAGTSAGFAGTDAIASITNISGSARDDVLTASLPGVASFVSGFGGDDRLSASDGDALDVVWGGPGTGDACSADGGEPVLACEL